MGDVPVDGLAARQIIEISIAGIQRVRMRVSSSFDAAEVPHRMSVQCLTLPPLCHAHWQEQYGGITPAMIHQT